MSNELSIITLNTAGDSWVDTLPGAVSTGYQAQNTAIQALFNGVDKSSVAIVGANAVISPSGIIDDSGVPFVVKTAVTLALPTSGAANWYLKVIAGGTTTERSLAWTDERGTYSASKNGFYSTSGERVLNWCYNINVEKLYKLPDTDIAKGADISGVGEYVNKSRNIYSEWGGFRTKEYTNKISVTGLSGICYNSLNDNLIYKISNDNLYIIERDGTAIGDVAISINNPRVGLAVDPLTGDLLYGNGNTNEITRYNGITNSVKTTYTNMYCDDLCIDSSGNLIGIRKESGVRKYIGISDTVDETLSIASASNGIAWDSWNNNLIIGYTINTGADTIMIYEGFSLKIIGRIVTYNSICVGLSFDTKYGVLWATSLPANVAYFGTIHYYGLLK